MSVEGYANHMLVSKIYVFMYVCLYACMYVRYVCNNNNNNNDNNNNNNNNKFKLI